MTALPARRVDADVVETVVVHGNLTELEPAERVAYYRKVCESVGLNPYTRPFEYITLSGKLTLYARKDCTDQLRQLHGVSVRIAGRDHLEKAGLYTVTAHAARSDGRVDESTGVVSTKGLTGEALANAMMKAETKAKRRVTLSICGLGWLDESEVDSIADSAPVIVDPETGEIMPGPGQSRRVLPRVADRPGYVTAARAKNALIDAYEAHGYDPLRAREEAAKTWGPRGSDEITEAHLEALIASITDSPEVAVGAAASGENTDGDRFVE